MRRFSFLRLRPQLIVQDAKGWTCFYCNYLNQPDAMECGNPFGCPGK